MSRVKTVQKSRKPLVCGRCQDPIPVGSPYRSTKPRYGSKKIRCMKPGCRFRPSDLSSAKTARIHDAVEDAQETISGAESHEDIQSALQEVASVAREVADEYQEASDNWGGGSGAGHEEFQEKADECGSFADDLEGWEYSGETDEEAVRRVAKDEDDDATEEDLDGAWEQELQNMRDEATDELSQFDL